MSEPIVEAVKPVHSTVNEVPIAVVPPNWKVESLEHLTGKLAPRFREGVANLHDVPSLVAYSKRYATRASVIYVDSARRCITAVLDDGDIPSIPPEAYVGRKADRAALSVALDPKFKLWTEFCSARRTQKDLIRFIEEYDSHFANPSGSEMRTLASKLDLKKNTTFKSVEKLEGAARDVSLQYETATNETGDIKFPSQVTIRIPVLEHQAEAQIIIRLFFELEGNAVLFSLRIPDPTSIVELAWKNVREQLTAAMKEQSLEVPVYNGSAPQWDT